MEDYDMNIEIKEAKTRTLGGEVHHLHANGRALVSRIHAIARARK